MAALSTLGRIRQARHESWLADLRRKTEEVGQACVKQGIGIEQVLLFGSRARGDFDGHSDVDLIAVGTTQQDAEESIRCAQAVLRIVEQWDTPQST